MSARRRVVAVGVAAALMAGAAAQDAAADPEVAGAAPPLGLAFNHVGSFFVPDNLADAEPVSTPTSAEIAAYTGDGRLLYTDALTERLGVVDIADPSSPQPLGAIDLPGSPTSVAVDGRYALVAIVTSDDFDNPTGELLVFNIDTFAVERTIPLAGQPDSVVISPNRRFAAIVIENERDEDENDGLIPQPPPGALQILELRGRPDRWTLQTVALTGLADFAPEDPEPEYVDVNRRDEAIVSLQENNHLVLVDLRRARVIRDFSAGTADIPNVDTVEEELGPQGNGIISLDGALVGRRREPDSVQWIDDDTFATANEGDYEDANGVEGGTRSFTLFNKDGRVEFEAGNTFEHEIVRAGHYPEARSENKGNEPEGLEVGRVRGRTLLFVASERANVVGVYDVDDGTPELLQLLPTGIGPEGLVFDRGLLAVTAEVDGADEGFLARSIITFFEVGREPPRYPYIRSADEAGLPIPWVALSGLAGDQTDDDAVWAVSDSFLAQAYLYRVDVSDEPATIVQRLAVGGVDVADQRFGDYDLEGVATRPEGGFWLASEGRTNVGSSRPNLIVRTDPAGTVLTAVPLPPALAANATSSGFEGVAVTGTQAAGNEVVWVAFQREWRDDPAGQVKIGRYEVATGTWTFARYRLDPVESPAGGFVGLSELTLLPDGTLAVVERDNQIGPDARIKRIYRIDPASVPFAPYGAALPVLDKVLLSDVLDELDAASITVPDKLEGLALTGAGELYAVTDNDGVEENYGETLFLQLS